MVRDTIYSISSNHPRYKLDNRIASESECASDREVALDATPTLGAAGWVKSEDPLQRSHVLDCGIARSEGGCERVDVLEVGLRLDIGICNRLVANQSTALAYEGGDGGGIYLSPSYEILGLLGNLLQAQEDADRSIITPV